MVNFRLSSGSIAFQRFMQVLVNVCNIKDIYNGYKSHQGTPGVNFTLICLFLPTTL